MKKLQFYLLPALFLLFITGCSESDEPGSGPYEKYDSLTGGSDNSGQGNDTIQAGQITAAEWNDLQHWDFWTNLRQNTDLDLTAQTWNLYAFDRCSFKVFDAENKPAIGCKVELKTNDDILWNAMTDNEGYAELWISTNALKNGPDKLSATIYYNNQSIEISEVKPYGQGVNLITLSETLTQPNQVDIHFMVDATGSMSDELEFLKAELEDVIQRVNTENSNYNFRYGSVFYRDVNDAYVTKIQSFTNEKNTLLSFIRNQSAAGGGDFPEAVHTALNMSLNQMEWNENNRASLCFLLLDAPPHENDHVITEINQLTQQAAQKGIKLIPIVASGIDKPTEFLMRSLAILTNGTYVFITNHSGIGNDHLEPTVGEYQVEYLNDLLVRLINQHIN